MRAPILAVLLAGCFGALEPFELGPGPEPVRIDKVACTSVLASAAVPADDARWAQLPPGFAPDDRLPGGGSNGRLASISVTGLRCLLNQVEGRTIDGSTVVIVALDVAPPAGFARAGARHAIVQAWSDETFEGGLLETWGAGGFARVDWRFINVGLAATGDATAWPEGATATLWGTWGTPSAEGAGHDMERWFLVQDRHVVGWIDVDSAMRPAATGVAHIDVAGPSLMATGGGAPSATSSWSQADGTCECPDVAWTWHAAQGNADGS